MDTVRVYNTLDVPLPLATATIFGREWTDVDATDVKLDQYLDDGTILRWDGPLLATAKIEEESSKTRQSRKGSPSVNLPVDESESRA